jgi:peroxiredoxin Q/BCP
MMQLHQDMEAFTNRDTIIVTIGPENAEAFKSFWAKNGYMYFGLPDENHTVLKMYGQQVKLFKFGRMPAQMLIDKNGILRFVHFGHDMQDIPSNEEILTLIDTL